MGGNAVRKTMSNDTNLTRNQYLMWLGQQAAPDKPIFNELIVFKIRGAIDKEHFDSAFQAVIDGTDALRSVIRVRGGAPIQEVLGSLKYSSEYIDLSGEEDPDATLDRWARAHVDSMCDLSRRAFESTLLRLSPDRFAWALLQHHIFSDATSMSIVFERVSAMYERSMAGQLGGPIAFSRFADYVRYEEEQTRSVAFAKRKAYWESKVQDPCEPVVFYRGASHVSTPCERVDRLEFVFGADESNRIRQLAAREGIRFLSDQLSIFSIFTAAFFAYLYRLTGQRRIAIGVPWQNRPNRFADTVGLLMEQAPMLVTFEAGETFESLIRKIQREAIDSMRQLPYAVGNPGGRLYNVTLNYVKASLGRFAGMAVEPRWYRPSYGSGSLGLRVHDFGGSGKFTLSFDFSVAQFSAADRQRTFAHFTNCLEACLEDPKRAIGTVELLGQAERLELETWNATTQLYPSDKTVVDLFEAQVARAPTAPAARFGGEILSYEALNARAELIAAELRSAGIAPGALVGVCLERSLDMLAGVLGVMKAGGAYVPLDPAFPRDRLAFMMADSGASVLLTESRLRGLVAHEGRVVVVDSLSSSGAHSIDRGIVRPDDLAYVLYTSGSTGKPKGVEIPHRALTNFLWAMRSRPGCTERDVLLAITTLSFDIAGLELFLPLVTGAQVEIASRAVAADGRKLRARLDDGGITILQGTPATWRMLLDAGWNGTPGLKALIGGEPLPRELVAPLLARTSSLWNMYGPTETTIWSSVHQVMRADEEITVGRPIANTTFHILDAYGHRVPVGVAGELYIGGDGVARGYRGRPELTAERFLPDPFSTRPGARMYRTGDAARYRADGNVVLLGRLDHQVKIRGYRIELGEIEATLSQHPGVRQAVVVAREDRSGQAQLAAYWVSSNVPAPTPVDLRAHLRQTLPDYMVPQYFVQLESLPLTPNGKVDRKTLPAPVAEATAIVRPRNEVEARVAAVFCDVLQLTEVSVQSDFFDLGGHSLLAVRLLSRLEEEFRVELPLQLLFEAPTVELLSRKICEITGSDPVAVCEAEEASGPRRPHTVTERRLAAIWSRILGVQVKSIDESFLELQGIRSLVASMLEEVRTEFGVFAEGLSRLSFETEPTIEALARVIDASIEPPSTLVVPLQPHGTRTPLFLIHAGGGYVFFYRALASRLGPDRPVYGVRAPTRADNLGLSLDRTRAVEELAARYIDEIKTIQKQGPYALGGACFGGVVAFEMARQLLERGETLAGPILLFDAYLKSDGGSGEYAFSRLKFHLRRARRFGLSALRDPVRKVLENPHMLVWLVNDTYRAIRRNLDSLIPEEWLLRLRGTSESRDSVHLYRMNQFVRASLRLIELYEPKPYLGAAVLFRTAESPDSEPEWKPWVTGSLVTHVLPGSHLDMMEEPAVVDTAALVRSHLDGDSELSAQDRRLPSQLPSCRIASDP